MAISSLASRASASTLFFTNLLRLNRSKTVVAPFVATRSGVARSIHTRAPLNYPDEETVKPFTTGGCYHCFQSSRGISNDPDEVTVYSDTSHDDDTCLQASRGTSKDPDEVTVYSDDQTCLQSSQGIINDPYQVTVQPFTPNSYYHCFIPSETSDNDSDNDSDDDTCLQSSRGFIYGMSSRGFMEHPFLTRGLSVFLYTEKYAKEDLVMVDMPGVSEEGLNIEIRNDKIYIEGKAEKEADYVEDMLPRIYSSVIALYPGPGSYNTDKIEVSMKFGVLKIVIPKLSWDGYLSVL